MDMFQDTGTITLNPSSSDVPYTFTFVACTSTTANDGSIPYGTSINSVVVTAHDPYGNTVADLINGTPSVASDVVTVELDYPAVEGDGNYHLEFAITLDSGAVMEVDFDRVYAED